jgi:zinc D-Ala-D-Ala dipeptidase
MLCFFARLSASKPHNCNLQIFGRYYHGILKYLIDWLLTPVQPLAFILIVFIAPISVAAQPLPPGFVFLIDVDQTIVQDMRYAGSNNFVGRALAGYGSPQCVLKHAAADALKLVQRELSKANLSLKVFDCYRPARAVRQMVQWVQDKEALSDDRYFPRIKKAALIVQGYIASRSGHSTGNVVDLTLVELSGAQAKEKSPIASGSCISKEGERVSDEGVNMGTSFDCFDTKSATESAEITSAQKQWRKTLVNAMAQHGFSNYSREWWHFSFRGGDPILDFAIPENPHSSAPPNPPKGPDSKPAGQ